MKNIKNNLLLIGVMLLSIFSFISPAYAAASATVGFTGSSSVAVGSNITVNLAVSNVSGTNGGVTSVSGNLVFDSNYLEYVSGSLAYSAYQGGVNPANNYKVSGVGTDGITSSANVFTFVFKAKQAGSTQVSVSNVKVSDNSGKFTATIQPKTITITGAVAPTPKSNDATLKSLGVTGYTLSPAFSSNTISYTVNVPKGTTQVVLTGAKNDTKANVTGLGTVTLTGDTTNASVKVTAEDGTIKTYTVKIVRETDGGGSGTGGDPTPSKDGDATLKSLNVSGYTLNPVFKSSVNTYSMKVTNNITGLKVTAVPTKTTSKVDISGNSNWKEGVNVITVKVTAEDGTVNSYKVNVTREAKADSNGKTTSTTKAKSSDNSLKSLIINSSHEITPAFDKETLTYDVTVPNSVTKLDLTYLSNDSKAKVNITGNENFEVGKVNIVNILVTAEDGSEKVYTLNVTRSTSNSDNDLEKIEIDSGNLNPKFDKDVLEYTVLVDSKTNTLGISAIPINKDSKVEVTGNKDLKEGHNTVLIKVTDKNGFKKIYTIDVVKASSEKKILGFSIGQFIILAILFLLLLGIILFLLLKRRKKDDDEDEPVTSKTTHVPIIEVKPEFNFGSKNSSDDDTVYGNMNQNSNIKNKGKEIEDSEEDIRSIEAKYEELEDKMPYDPYDQTVTKRELIDAIRESTITKDTTKLEMLLEQDEINQRRKKMKKKEEKRNKNSESNDEE